LVQDSTNSSVKLKCFSLPNAPLHAHDGFIAGPIQGRELSASRNIIICRSS
jgi:hypothetical protein